MNMKWFFRIVLLLAILLLGALGWQWLAADPGQVQVQIRGYLIETTVVVATAFGLLAFATLWLLLWLLRAPLRWLAGRRRRRARHAFAQAELRLREGLWGKAEKLFLRAADDPDFRIPALLEAAQAAHSRGDAAQAQAHLARLDAEPEGRRLVQLERAREALASDRPEEAGALLAGIEQLPPSGLLLRVQALCASHRAGEALVLLPELHRSHLLDGLAWAKQELAVALQALDGAGDRGALEQVWNALPKGLRRTGPVIEAYVERVLSLGGGGDAAALIEEHLRQDWSETLVRRYGQLEQPEPAQRLRHAEKWLVGHADSIGLHLALGQISLQQGALSQAEEFLGHALALGSDAGAWELLAEVYSRQQQHERARVALGNALRVRRGLAAMALPGVAARADHLGLFAVAEERSEHGVPRLPGGH